MAVLDEVLERLTRDRGLTFHLDGQVALVDDYLAVRPDAADRLRALVAAGRLSLGPWYVLADELLAGDEPLVRNLFEGRRRAADLGGWLPVGYSPDAFGHPAALPTILAGFGIVDALLWRGYGGRPGQDGALFRWRAPDGAEVLVHHLPAPGYEYGAELPTGRAAAAARWQTLRDLLVPRAAVPVLLVLNGADHHALQPNLRTAVGALRRAAAGATVTIGTLADYFAATRGALSPTQWTTLPRAAGELRWSYGHAWTLQGVSATRTALKQAIAEGASLLVRWAEPQIALAQVAGGADRRALLHAVWRTHLGSLSHDVLAGCVADEVADDVAVRTRHVREEARGLLTDALDDRLAQDPVRRRRDPSARVPALVLVNPSPYPRAGVVEATVTLFAADEIVGRPAPPASPRGVAPFVLEDRWGRVAPHQVLSVALARERLDSPRDYPDQDRVWAVRVAVAAPRVPAFGLTRLAVRERDEAAAAREPVTATPQGLRTAWGSVRADPAGFTVRVGTRSLRLVPLLTSERDEGDTYTIEPVEGDRPLAARWGKAKGQGGPLVAALARPFRIGQRVRGTVFVRVDAGSSLVRLVVEGENRAGQHRLRMRLPVGARGRATADMPYGAVTRPLVRFAPDGFPSEWPATTAPMHRWVSAGGWTVCTRGLHEYELLPDGTIAVTLLRAVGDLSRGLLRARPGHAGWPTPTPGAQGLGRFRVELALAPVTAAESSGPDAWDAVERVAEEFHAPLAGRMYRTGVDVPGEVAGPALEGRGLAFRALKPRDDGPGVVLRCVNLTRRARQGAWTFPSPVTRAFRARLDETLEAELALSADRCGIEFRAGPREIVTVVVER